MIVTLITVGKYLEARSKDKTTEAVNALVSLIPQTAVVIRNGREETVPANELRAGQIRWRCARGRPSLPTAWWSPGSGAVDAARPDRESLPGWISGGRPGHGRSELSTTGYIRFTVDKTG